MTELDGVAADDHHRNVDPHVRIRWLSDLVLGAQDGLVNTLGVVLGVAAATPEPRVVVATGLAAAAAESLSMAAVAYTSSLARGDMFLAERRREARHLATVPHLERDEIRAIYTRKGFRGELLEQVVETICADPEVWLDEMMREEHRLTPVDRADALRAAVVVGVASVVGSVLPVMPFLLLERGRALWVSALTSVALLFALGAYESRITVGRPLRGGLALAMIGSASALLGWLVGMLVTR